ncbi:mechanosensitive ion channel [Microbacterium sp. 2MCAF23]|uniref:mechanosensitive ion channel n=1 Tax=Microbacterium sp. 2MCAF23 TaxID=3232985 RepID=UPI003F97213A
MQLSTGSIDWLSIGMKVLIAIVILLVTWLIAWIVRWIFARLVGRIGFLRRQGADGAQVGQSIGQIASLLVWLLGLIAVLQVFSLNQVLAPLQGLVDGVLGYLPNIIGAGIVFFIGFVLAKIARQLVVTALGTVDFSRFGRRLGAKADSATGTAHAETVAAPVAENKGKIVPLIGNLVFGVIVIVVAIAALQVLGIAAISRPAEQMLTMFLAALPAIIAAVILLAIGYVIARFLGELLEGLLQAGGTDRALSSAGVVPEGTSASTIITRIVQTAIMIFFAIMATRLLGFPEVTRILDQILAVGGRVLLGGVVIAAGFLIASVLARVLGDSTMVKVLRYATIALFAAMGLKAMGLADSIINLAFGAVVIAAGLAAALAFGLGGREAAGRTLNRLAAKAEAAMPSHAEPAAPAPAGSAPAASPSAASSGRTATGAGDVRPKAGSTDSGTTPPVAEDGDGVGAPN